jgi:hypothetical protein
MYSQQRSTGAASLADTQLPRSYNLPSTVSSLDSQTNSVVRMTLLGVFA